VQTVLPSEVNLLLPKVRITMDADKIGENRVEPSLSGMNLQDNVNPSHDEPMPLDQHGLLADAAMTQPSLAQQVFCQEDQQESPRSANCSTVGGESTATE
ncbi:hypothetical protein PFISCL1PPCAC_13596, partial [Pristionchus fissidentatus]